MAIQLQQGEQVLKTYKVGVKTVNEIAITNKRIIKSRSEKLTFGETEQSIPLRSIVMVTHDKRKKLLGDVYIHMVGGYVEEIHVLDSNTSYEIYEVINKLIL